MSDILDADHLKERHEYSINLDGNIIYLEGDLEDLDEEASAITWRTARKFRKNLTTLIQGIEEDIKAGDAEQEIIVEIDSPGGDEQAGMSIYDSIKKCKFPITGHVTGECSSMASVVLQAFPKRVLEPHASVMYHSGSAWVGTPGQEFKAASEYIIKYGKEIDEIMYQRALEKQPTLTRAKFDLMVMKGVYLNAHEAVEFGWADEVV